MVEVEGLALGVAGVYVGVKAVDKLIDVVASGIGAITAPWRLKQMAAAEVEAQAIRASGQIRLKLMEVEGERQLAELRAAMVSKSLPSLGEDSNVQEVPVYEGELIESDVSSLPPLTARAEARFRYQEAKRQFNVERIVAVAYNEIPSEVSSQPVDDDWVARFFEGAKDVSNEEMRKLWGKLLAGEVAAPGCYSVRTLDVLRNLSPVEARLFEKACSRAFDEGVILSDESVSGLSVEETMVLVDCGLLQSGLAWCFEDEEAVGYCDKQILFRRRVAGSRGVGACRLSRAAQELRRLLSLQPDAEFLKALELLARDSGLTMTVVDKVATSPSVATGF
ncbi:DUF2806 domain-containing protein [Sorangium sp. So ce204]|uniref:DUF2806 domain-containing protein n=1 Tax=Sorangium sp. So ce204 TaxID=3133288 RepID=UPI003F6368C2